MTLRNNIAPCIEKDYFTIVDAFASDRMLCGAIVYSNKIASERQHQLMRINRIAEKIIMLIKEIK
jgi:hypothetical protein